MRVIGPAAAVLAILIGATAPLPALAQAQPADTQTAQTQAAAEPLFVNLTSDDVWRAAMALSFARNAQNQGHPVTVFLNVEAVRLASTAIPQIADSVSGKTAPDMLAEIMTNGGTVLICQMCMAHAGVRPETLIDGVQLGTPQVTLPALFRDGGRSLSF